MRHLPVLNLVLLLALTACVSDGERGAAAEASADPAVPSGRDASPSIFSAAPGAHPLAAQLVWLAGRWTARAGDAWLEEWWSAPAADGLVCAFRWVQGGRTTVHEIVTITAEDDTLVFRLRHFSPGLEPWPDEPLEMRLASVSHGEAVFTRPGEDFPTRLVYRRTGERLAVELSGGGGEMTFDFRRAPPAP